MTTKFQKANFTMILVAMVEGLRVLSDNLRDEALDTIEFATQPDSSSVEGARIASLGVSADF